MGSHGGRRAGTGRKRILTRLERLDLGNAIEYRLRRKTNAMFNRSIQEKLPPQLEQIRAYSIADRRWLKAQWQRQHGNAEYDPEQDDSVLGDLILDARAVYKSGPPKYRGVVIRGPRQAAPKILKEILASVARAVSRRCGVALKERHAKTCLVEYRRDRAKWYSENALGPSSNYRRT
jgi:hypothetical protein